MDSVKLQGKVLALSAVIYQAGARKPFQKRKFNAKDRCHTVPILSPRGAPIFRKRWCKGPTPLFRGTHPLNGPPPIIDISFEKYVVKVLRFSKKRCNLFVSAFNEHYISLYIMCILFQS